LSLAALFLAIASSPISAPAQAPRGGGQGPQVVSPEVSADRQVTFRLLAPKAQSVRVSAGDIPGNGQGKEMTKGTNDVWEATLGPVGPGAYRYNFSVDGLAVIDPRNPATSESNNNTWSLVRVPGAEFMDTREVPHGAVASLTYYSTTLKRFRRMHVYTPPGYELGKGKFPVFYLMHGARDSDDSWSSVGPAVDEFVQDFLTDILPYVEKHYRVYADRKSRALAGLSMGGGQTLNIGIPHLEQFAYLGVFSSGVFGITGTNAPAGPTFEERHAAKLDDAKLKAGLKSFWFATGKDDFLVQTSRATVAMFKKHGFDVVYHETEGAHTWINWREYLRDFAPLLFQ
jgi:enterochelin esterase family protein